MITKLPVVSLMLISLFLTENLSHAGEGSRFFSRKVKVSKVNSAEVGIIPPNGDQKRSDQSSNSDRNQEPKNVLVLPNVVIVHAPEDLAASERADEKRFAGSQADLAHSLPQELKRGEPPVKTRAQNNDADQFQALKNFDGELSQEDFSTFLKLIATSQDDTVKALGPHYLEERLRGDRFNCWNFSALTPTDLSTLMYESKLFKIRVFQCSNQLDTKVLDGLVSSNLPIEDLERLLRAPLRRRNRPAFNRAVTYVSKGDEQPSSDSSVLVLPPAQIAGQGSDAEAKAERFLKTLSSDQKGLANLRMAVLHVAPHKSVESNKSPLERALKILQKAPKLEMIDIANNQFTETTLDALKKVMAVNSITHLRFKSVQIQAHVLLELSKHLRSYKPLRSVKFHRLHLILPTGPRWPGDEDWRKGWGYHAKQALEELGRNEHLGEMEFSHSIEGLGIEYVADFVLRFPHIHQLRFTSGTDLPLALNEFLQETREEPDHYFELDYGIHDYEPLIEALQIRHHARTLCIKAGSLTEEKHNVLIRFLQKQKKYHRVSIQVHRTVVWPEISGFQKFEKESGLPDTTYLRAGYLAL